MKAAAMVDFDDIRPMAPRPPIRLQGAHPPAIPEPQIFHLNHHIYRGHLDAPVFPELPDIPHPLLEIDNFNDGEQHSSSDLRSKWIRVLHSKSKRFPVKISIHQQLY
jgi:hypothetical protein